MVGNRQSVCEASIHNAKCFLQVLVSISLDTRGDQAGEGNTRFSDNGWTPHPCPTHHRIPTKVLLELSSKAGPVQNRKWRSVEFVFVRPAKASKKAVFVAQLMVDANIPLIDLACARGQSIEIVAGMRSFKF